ncbi:MAG: hypothetical protein HY348_07900 [Nitrospira defluvii]|nr:hypothetical protein [Nitrospira defluvii]
MNRCILAALMLVGVMGTVGPARGNEAVAVFPMSSVENVDVRNQLLTFKTNDGRLWLLRVADPATMKRESLVKGDVVRIEVDLDDQIVRIVKVAHSSESDRQGSRFK